MNDQAVPPREWDRWKTIEPIFDAVLDLPQAERAAYLDSVTTGNPELREVVERFLASIEGSAGYLSRPAAEAFPDLIDHTAPEQDRIGTLIGPYRIVREAGRGGMGTVYVAERADDQYQGRVALKVLRGDHDPALVRRFRSERQILATLTHPRIARLYDGGLTADGQPWFAMELVEGTPLTEYCDGEKKSIEQRLRLFLSVCGAVAFAHRNLVVHRDLKPSNILVSATGEVTLLDFGIAKVLDRSGPTDDGASPTTQLMTPEYASPEQVRGDAITTATDIYSLGVVLCELLCGARPHARKGRPIHELTRALLEDDPERASTIIAGADAAVLAARRGTSRSLARQLRGDLDTIVLTCLEKQADRRYSSVEQLSSDVRGWLAGMPVMARPATVGYRARKFVRRHPFGIAATTLVLAMLTGFAVVTRAQLGRVQHEREAAQEISDFLTQLFLRQSPSVASEKLTARDVLDTAGARLLRTQRVQSAARAHLLDQVGYAYWQLRDLTRAEVLLDSAIAIHRRLGTKPEAYRATRSRLNAVVAEKGEWALAESLARAEVEFAEKTYGPMAAEVVSARILLGEILASAEREEEAYAYMRRTVEIVRAGNPEMQIRKFALLRDLGQVILDSRFVTDSTKLREAEAALTEQTEILKRPGYRSQPISADGFVQFVRMRHALGDTAAATLLRESIAIHRERVGDDNIYVDFEKTSLADILADRGEFAAAESLYREVWPRETARFAARDLEYPSLAVRFSSILLSRGRLSEADSILRRALPIAWKYWSPDGWHVASVKAALGTALVRRGRFAEAKPLLEVSLPVVETRYGPNDRLTIAARLALESITKPRNRR